MERDQNSLSLLYRVRKDDLDAVGKLSISALTLYLQDAAARHAADLGFSVPGLAEKGHAWVLVRFRIRIQRDSGWKESIEVKTWPSGVNRLFALRDYRVSSHLGERVATADSAWVIMDTNTRCPVRLPRSFAKLVPGDVERMFSDSLPSVCLEGIAFTRQGSLHVRSEDVDFNGHVNHSRYIEWTARSLESRIGKGFNLRGLTMEFKGEALEGDEVVLEASEFQVDPEGKRARCRLLAGDSGRVLTLADALFRPVVGGAT